MTQLKVLMKYQIGKDDFRGIVQSNKGNRIYTVYTNNYGQWCACDGFRYRAKCSHLRLFQNEFKPQEYEIMENYIPTSIEGVNAVLGSGLPKGMLVGFYGTPQSAKTTTAIWSALDGIKFSGRNLLYIDTEMGIAAQFLPAILARFNKINKTDIGIKHTKINFKKWVKQPSAIVDFITISDDEKQHQVVVVDIPTIQQLLLFVGMPVDLDLSSAKPTIKLHNKAQALFPYSWNSPMARIMDDPNSDQDEFGGFVLDSFTSVMKIFGSETQNFPTRDTAQSIVLSELSALLSENYWMFGITVIHASKPPQDVNAKSRPVGGKSVGHAFKFVVQFSDPKREALNTIVTIQPYRLPTSLDGKLKAAQVTINDSGVF